MPGQIWAGNPVVDWFLLAVVSFAGKQLVQPKRHRELAPAFSLPTVSTIQIRILATTGLVQTVS